MDLLCNVCDRSIIETESEFNKNLATLQKQNDKIIYKKYTTNDNNLDDVKKILNDYISTPNKKTDFFLIDCEFKIKFDKNFTTNIKNNYQYNTDYINIKNCLLFFITSFEYGEYKISNINHMISHTISCMCNMTYKHYINKPMPAVERRINMTIAKNPQLINSLSRNKNHPLINKYSRIQFNNI